MEGLAPVDILLHGVNIVVLFVLLRLILWRPITRFLAAREARIAAELDSAAATRNEAGELKAEYEESIGALEERGREIMRDSQLRSDAQSKEIVDNAKQQAEKMLTAARERIDAERTDAIHDARHEIAQLAAEMASSILRREVSVDDSLAATRDFFGDQTGQMRS